jgi:hypothetical protein
MTPFTVDEMVLVNNTLCNMENAELEAMLGDDLIGLILQKAAFMLAQGYHERFGRQLDLAALMAQHLAIGIMLGRMEAAASSEIDGMLG